MARLPHASEGLSVTYVNFNSSGAKKRCLCQHMFDADPSTIDAEMPESDAATFLSKLL